MPQTHAIGSLGACVHFNGYQHRGLKRASAFTVHQIPIRDLSFDDHTRFVDFREIFKDGRPVSNLLFPSAFVDLKSAPHGNGSDWFLFREVGNRFATGFVLNEGAFARELLDCLFVGRIRCQPQCVTNGAIIIIDYRLRRDAGGRWSLKTWAGHEFGIVEVIVAHSHLCLYIPSPIDVGPGERAEGRRCAISFLIKNDVLNEIWLFEIFELQFRYRSAKFIAHRTQYRICG